VTASRFQRYLMPALVFESIVIGGGYATGRELVEFFLGLGPRAGLLAMCVTLIVWSMVLAVSFELARVTQSFDYRSFCGQILGRFWFIYDLLYYALLVLVMSVIGAACGSLFRDSFQLPAMAGIATLMGVVAVLVYFGNSLVERALSYWAIVLYALYGSLGLWCLLHYAHPVWSNLQKPVDNSRWVTGGLRYAGYNLAAVPGVLFCIRHLATRRESVIAGLLCGPIAIIPAALLYIALISFYPSITDEPVPSIYILSRIGSRGVALLFQIALFVTLAKTGTGLLHALNERVATACTRAGKTMPSYMRSVMSLAILLFSVFLANRVGIIDLIAHGYGSLTWGFLLAFVLPVMTIGLWKVFVGARFT
jgi:uncharacterized membrane protein YkvI